MINSLRKVLLTLMFITIFVWNFLIIYQYRELMNIFLSLSLLITMFLGLLFNYLAISFNDFKMPVLNGGDSIRHKRFVDKSEVKLYHLCDIFSLRIWRSHGIIYSIGDVFLVIFTILMIILMIITW